MDLILNCQNVGKTFSSKPIFSNISLAVKKGERLGIVGPNGSGKSTFLRILAGDETADEGEIVVQRGSRINYVRQASAHEPAATVGSYVRKAAASVGVREEDIARDASQILGRAGFADEDQLVANLSGGWKKRLEICAGLVGAPDLVLLDEPTNHLDVQGIWWLEQILGSAAFAWIAVSHDRAFLQNTASRVAEINRQYASGILIAEGNYEKFLEQRLDYFASQSRQEESLANIAKRELEWLRQGVKARTTKSKHRVDVAESLQSDLRDMRSRLKTEQTKIEFSDTGKKSKKLVSVKGISKRLGDKEIIKTLDFDLVGGSKIGILGRNGSGKSTILKLLAGVLSPDTGSIQMVQGLTTVFFDQNRDSLRPEWTLKRAFSETGDTVIFQDRPIHVVTWARRFLFSHEQLDKRVSDLSGGERAKVIIARLMLQKADLLLLDEPTNDLDISTMETLEDSLLDFPGAVVLVTHDRYMIQKVCSSFIGLDGRGHAIHFADYEQWEKSLRSEGLPSESAKKITAAKSESGKIPLGPKKLSYKDQREYDGMEEAILKQEEIVAVHRSMTEDPTVATDSRALEKAFVELHASESELERLYRRWAELEALIG